MSRTMDAPYRILATGQVLGESSNYPFDDSPWEETRITIPIAPITRHFKLNAEDVTVSVNARGDLVLVVTTRGETTNRAMVTRRA